VHEGVSENKRSIARQWAREKESSLSEAGSSMRKTPVICISQQSLLFLSGSARPAIPAAAAGSCGWAEPLLIVGDGNLSPREGTRSIQEKERASSSAATATAAAAAAAAAFATNVS